MMIGSPGQQHMALSEKGVSQSPAVHHRFPMK